MTSVEWHWPLTRTFLQHVCIACLKCKAMVACIRGLQGRRVGGDTDSELKDATSDLYSFQMLECRVKPEHPKREVLCNRRMCVMQAGRGDGQSGLASGEINEVLLSCSFVFHFPTELSVPGGVGVSVGRPMGVRACGRARGRG